MCTGGASYTYIHRYKHTNTLRRLRVYLQLLGIPRLSQACLLHLLLHQCQSFNGLVFKAHRLLYLSTLGLRVIAKTREGVGDLGARGAVAVLPRHGTILASTKILLVSTIILIVSTIILIVSTNFEGVGDLGARGAGAVLPRRALQLFLRRHNIPSINLRMLVYLVIHDSG